MNVQFPCWAGQAPNPQLPLCAGLRAAYALDPELPPEITQLLRRLSQLPLR